MHIYLSLIAPENYRLPHVHHNVQPTTMEHSKSLIRVSHTLGVEIRYKKDVKAEHRVQLMKNVNVSSVCLLTPPPLFF